MPLGFMGDAATVYNKTSDVSPWTVFERDKRSILYATYTHMNEYDGLSRRVNCTPHRLPSRYEQVSTLYSYRALRRPWLIKQRRWLGFSRDPADAETLSSVSANDVTINLTTIST